MQHLYDGYYYWLLLLRILSERGELAADEVVPPFHVVAGLRFRRLKVSHLYDLEQPEEPQQDGLARPHRVQGGGPEHVRGHLVGVLEVALREDEEAAGLECLVDGREVREGVPRVLKHVDDEQRVEVV